MKSTKSNKNFKGVQKVSIQKKTERKPTEQHSKYKGSNFLIATSDIFHNVISSKIFSYNIIIYLFLLIFVYIFFMNAWVGDDAYITFRTVDNFIKGHGLVWNIGERVQGFTHPLWMFTLSIGYFFINNILYVSTFLSFIFSLAALYLLVLKLADNKINGMLAIILLIFSKAFIDYTSSGLENALSYFLAILFFLVYFREENKNRLLILSLITSLSATNRLDTILFFVPVLMYELWENRSLKNIMKIIIGFAPFILWEIFSLFYYGFPFPNTYYAKLYTGIPTNEYIGQGFCYFINSFKSDPLTLIVISATITVMIILLYKKFVTYNYLPLIIGIILYLFYIIYIGGDFMSGRFFSVPFFISIIILSRLHINYQKPKSALLIPILSVIIIITCIFSSNIPVFSGLKYGTDNGKKILKKLDVFIDKYGIADERAFYYSDCGFLPVLFSGKSVPDFNTIKDALETNKNKYKVLIRGGIGMFGFYANRDIYIIDQFALTDALLARLPQSQDPNWLQAKWRIGHFYRYIPDGYFETILTGKNQIKDKRVAEFYDNLCIITKGDLFNSNRLKEIWEINTGKYKELLARDYDKTKLPYPYSGDSLNVAIYYKGLGLHYYDKKDYNSALKSFKEAFSNFPQNTDYFNNIVFLFIITEQLDSAYSYLSNNEDFASTSENINTIYKDLAKAYYSRKNFGRAIELVKKAINLNEHDAQAYMNLGLFYFNSGNKESGVDCWQKAINIDPNIHQAYFYLLNYYFYDKKDYPNAALNAVEYQKLGGKIEDKMMAILKNYIK